MLGGQGGRLRKKRPHPKMGPNDRTEVQICSWWQMNEGGGVRHLPGGYRSREEDTTSTRVSQTRTEGGGNGVGHIDKINMPAPGFVSNMATYMSAMRPVQGSGLPDDTRAASARGREGQKNMASLEGRARPKWRVQLPAGGTDAGHREGETPDVNDGHIGRVRLPIKRLPTCQLCGFCITAGIGAPSEAPKGRFRVSGSGLASRPTRGPCRR